MKRRRTLGFTLVEIMVSLVISAMLVGMILAIWGRMSIAYRGQHSIAELQQILSAAHELVEADLRQAGFQISDGFFVAGDVALHQPVEIVDDADGLGPDQLRIFAADASAVARVQDFNGLDDSETAAFTSLAVDTAADFAPGDVAVIVKAQDGLPQEVAFFACVVEIAGVNGNLISLATTLPWGTPNNDQCDQVRTDGAIEGGDRAAIVYRFRARGYRIDPDRRDLAVLQLSPTAGIVDDWQDLGVGFTDLQIASLWDDTDDPAAVTADTDDVDADPTREWWSDATQTALSGPVAATSVIPPAPWKMSSFSMARPRVVAVRVSLVVRPHTKVDLTPSPRTPALVDPARPANNDLGNHDAEPIEGVYRHATVGTDLRNLGVGM